MALAVGGIQSGVVGLRVPKEQKDGWGLRDTPCEGPLPTQALPASTPIRFRTETGKKWGNQSATPVPHRIVLLAQCHVKCLAPLGKPSTQGPLGG